MSQYTKGEWKIHKGIAGESYDIIYSDTDEGRVTIAKLPHQKVPGIRLDANARLISKAPQMYEALKVIFPWAKEYITYLRRTIGAGQGKDADIVFNGIAQLLSEIEEGK